MNLPVEHRRFLYYILSLGAVSLLLLGILFLMPLEAPDSKSGQAMPSEKKLKKPKPPAVMMEKPAVTGENTPPASSPGAKANEAPTPPQGQ